MYNPSEQWISYFKDQTNVCLLVNYIVLLQIKRTWNCVKNKKINIQFWRRVVHNMNSFFQVTSAFATRDNGLTFFCLFWCWMGSDKWYLATLILLKMKAIVHKKERYNNSSTRGSTWREVDVASRSLAYCVHISNCGICVGCEHVSSVSYCERLFVNKVCEHSSIMKDERLRVKCSCSFEYRA